MSEKKERKHKGRYAYLNDFRLNENNEYVYEGKIYEIELDEDQKKRLIIGGSLMQLLLMAFSIGSGFIPFSGTSGTFYVVIPLAFEIIMILLQLPALYKIFTRDTLREYEYRKSYERLRPYYFVIAINAAIGFAGSLIFGRINGFEPLMHSLPYIFCRFAVFALSLYLFRYYQILTYRQIQ
ncbi:MAG: hypothetical protein J6S38_04260 [Erysipelotrichaceae bacterium]|nr:hypothetical protein [Erysipelotrichaceae bacterium]MBP5279808.1 hypothetical protein [Erysipelotrichaceae bacterium]